MDGEDRAIILVEWTDIEHTTTNIFLIQHGRRREGAYRVPCLDWSGKFRLDAEGPGSFADLWRDAPRVATYTR